MDGVRIDVDWADGRCGVTLHGRLTADVVDLFDDAVGLALDHAAGRHQDVVVDLRDVERIDARGEDEVRSLAARARRAGCRVLIRT